MRIAVDADPRGLPPLRRGHGERLEGRDGDQRHPPTRRRRPHGARTRRGLRTRLRKEAALAYLLLLPALVLFGVFTFYPFLRNFKLMLYETPPVPGLPSHYVGLHQIVPTLTSTEFTQSLVTTLRLRRPGGADQPRCSGWRWPWRRTASSRAWRSTG